jgi:hypothetical protein
MTRPQQCCQSYNGNISMLPLLFESLSYFHNPVTHTFQVYTTYVQMDLFVVIVSKHKCFRSYFESDKVSILSLLIVLCLSGLAWDEGGQLLIVTSGEEVVKWNSKNHKFSRLVVTC